MEALSPGKMGNSYTLLGKDHYGNLKRLTQIQVSCSRACQQSTASSLTHRPTQGPCKTSPLPKDKNGEVWGFFEGVLQEVQKLQKAFSKTVFGCQGNQGKAAVLSSSINGWLFHLYRTEMHSESPGDYPQRGTDMHSSIKLQNKRGPTVAACPALLWLS